MKVLYITTISNTINSFLIPQIEELINKGFSVDVATNVNEEVDKSLLQIGCNVFDIPFQRNPFSFKNISAYFKIRKLMKDYDLIHTHTPVASMVSRIASLKYKRNGLKVIYTAHGFHFYEGSSFISWIIYYPIEKLLSHTTDFLITINTEDYNTSKKHLHANKNIYIPGVGIDRNKFKDLSEEETIKIRRDLNFNKEDFIITFIGELNKNKNQTMLLEAIRKVYKEKNNIRVLLIGSGPMEKELKEYIKRLNLENNIFLLGFRKDINQILSVTDIYVSTSNREGLPVNIIEAMSKGLPIVATNIRGHRDLINHLENGVLIEKNNDRLLALNLLSLLNDRELREKLGARNFEKISKYDLNNVIPKIVQITEEALL